MKKISVCLLVLMQIFCVACGYTNTEEETRLLRIHVRADSDSASAQAVKKEVVSAIQYYLSGELQDVRDYDTAYATVKARTSALAAIASGVLRSKGFGYGATARLTREYFPARVYDGRVVESGEYDALIVRLGTGGGDNWWCVLYPQLCYTVTSEQEGVYKSLIAEILGKL